MPLLSATGIDKRFGGVVALDGAEFACEAGEIHALLGENGAGKSTMVKVLCGVHPPDAGTIAYDGETGHVSAVRPTRWPSGIVPVFQELSLVPDLTVAENLFMGEEPRNRLGLVDGQTDETRGRRARWSASASPGSTPAPSCAISRSPTAS